MQNNKSTENDDLTKELHEPFWDHIKKSCINALAKEKNVDYN